MNHALFPKCLVCKASIRNLRFGRLYCSNKCRQKAYRDRTFTPVGAPVHHDRNHKPKRRNAGTPPLRKPARPTHQAGSDPKPPEVSKPTSKRKPNKTRRPAGKRNAAKRPK